MDSICDFCSLMVEDGSYWICSECGATFCADHSGSIEEPGEELCVDCMED